MPQPATWLRGGFRATLFVDDFRLTPMYHVRAGTSPAASHGALLCGPSAPTAPTPSGRSGIVRAAHGPSWSEPPRAAFCETNATTCMTSGFSSLAAWQVKEERSSRLAPRGEVDHRASSGPGCLANFAPSTSQTASTLFGRGPARISGPQWFRGPGRKSGIPRMMELDPRGLDPLQPSHRASSSHSEHFPKGHHCQEGFSRLPFTGAEWMSEAPPGGEVPPGGRQLARRVLAARPDSGFGNAFAPGERQEPQRVIRATCPGRP